MCVRHKTPTRKILRIFFLRNKQSFFFCLKKKKTIFTLPLQLAHVIELFNQLNAQLKVINDPNNFNFLLQRKSSLKNLPPKHFDFSLRYFPFNSFFFEHPKFHTYNFFSPPFLHTLKIFLWTLRFFSINTPTLDIFFSSKKT